MSLRLMSKWEHITDMSNKFSFEDGSAGGLGVYDGELGFNRLLL